MDCRLCRKRNRCVSICIDVEIILAEKHVSTRELPLGQEKLKYLQEEHLKATFAPYEDRHSHYMADLEQRLRRLTQRQREIISMFYWEGLSMIEIGRRLKISLRAVYSRLNNAVKRLSENELL